MNNWQKAVWVAVVLILVVLSIGMILQARAISQAQDTMRGIAPMFRNAARNSACQGVAGFLPFSGPCSDSRRIADLEEQVMQDRWQLERLIAEERKRERGW